MALKSSIADSTDWITTKQKSIGEVFTFTPYVGDALGTPIVSRRLRNITDAVVVAVAKATALAYVATKATDSGSDSNTTYTANEDNRYCGSFTVTRHVDSRGAWVQDT